uniref:Uncharacterized protein n=1 Tax=viral metagenome TaxID=1070528 RepID=A0A6C0CH64_9ZZZZ
MMLQVLTCCLEIRVFRRQILLRTLCPKVVKPANTNLFQTVQQAFASRLESSGDKTGCEVRCQKS